MTSFIERGADDDDSSDAASSQRVISEPKLKNRKVLEMLSKFCVNTFVKISTVSYTIALMIYGTISRSLGSKYLYVLPLRLTRLLKLSILTVRGINLQ